MSELDDIEDGADNQALTEENESLKAKLLIVRQDLKKASRRLRRTSGAAELLCDRAEEIVADYVPIKAPPLPRRGSTKMGEEIAVLHLSDWQIGAIGRGAPEEVFNTQVARERVMDILLPKVVNILRLRQKGARLSRLIILWGGDNVDGSNLRANQAWDVDSDVMEQACDNAPAILEAFVTALMGEVQTIEIDAVPGNHGRSGPFKGDSNPDRVNWDTVSTKFFQARMGDKIDGKRLSLHIAEEDFVHVVNVGEKKILNLHGHQFSGSGGMAGFPIYSIATSMAKWALSRAYEFDYMFFGHYHLPTHGCLGHHEYYLNGSLQTGSRFVREVIKTKGRPCQRLVIFDPKRGPIADHLLYLDDFVTPGAEL